MADVSHDIDDGHLGCVAIPVCARQSVLALHLLVRPQGCRVEVVCLDAALRAGGAVQIIGLAGGTLPLGAGALPFDRSPTVPYWGSAGELFEVGELARSGRIPVHTERFALDEVEVACARLRAGTLPGRAVITPPGLPSYAGCSLQTAAGGPGQADAVAKIDAGLREAQAG